MLALCMVACRAKQPPEVPGAGDTGFFRHDAGFPGPHGGDMLERANTRMTRMKKELGITDAQEKELKKLRDARSAKMSALAENIWAKREAVMKELSKPDYIVDKARKAHTEMKALSDQLEDNRFEGLLEARKILTDKQIKMISEMRPPRRDGPGAPDSMLGIGRLPPPSDPE